MRLVHFRPSKRHSRRGKSRRHASRRRSHRRYRRNPSRGGGALRTVLSPSNFIQITAVTVGFIGGAKVGGMIYDKVVPSSMRRFAGLATFALGAFAASKVKNDMVKKAAAGMSAAGVYDLIAQNFSAAGLKPVSGDTIDMNGIDLVGDDGRVYAGDTIDVSGDMTELVGDDEDGSNTGVYA